MIEVVFYDCSGAAIAYLDEDAESIYLFDGTPVAWLDDYSIYSYSGKHKGWLIDSWVRDHDGRCVFFTEDAKGGPVRPCDRYGLYVESGL
jgi:hypothetical protein